MQKTNFQKNVHSFFNKYNEEEPCIETSFDDLENTWNLKKVLIEMYKQYTFFKDPKAEKICAMYSYLECMLAKNNTYNFADINFTA